MKFEVFLELCEFSERAHSVIIEIDLKKKLCEGNR